MYCERKIILVMRHMIKWKFLIECSYALLLLLVYFTGRSQLPRFFSPLLFYFFFPSMPLLLSVKAEDFPCVKRAWLKSDDSVGFSFLTEKPKDKGEIKYCSPCKKRRSINLMRIWQTFYVFANARYLCGDDRCICVLTDSFQTNWQKIFCDWLYFMHGRFCHF